MSSDSLLMLAQFIRLKGGLSISVHERWSSHDTYVVIAYPEHRSPELYEFENEDLAREFVSEFRDEMV